MVIILRESWLWGSVALSRPRLLYQGVIIALWGCQFFIKLCLVVSWKLSVTSVINILIRVIPSRLKEFVLRFVLIVNIVVQSPSFSLHI